MPPLWIIPILPLLGFALNGLFGRRLGKPAINAIACGSVLLSFATVLFTLNKLGVFAGTFEGTYSEHYFNWIQSGYLSIGVDLAIDRLTCVMLMVVTGVGFLIHVYATGYMAHEGGYYRFFAYLNLFMFFMLTLVLGANYLILFVGWEGVGLCSYLLIGFYFLEQYATTAGNKAFIVNRIGDFGFTLAVFLIAIHFGSLDFKTVFAKVAPMDVESSAGWMTAIALLLLVGACGKSAQLPLYVWLPDAMAGPTPVSALIHAATMVTAGVYMVARSSQIFLHAAGALNIVAIVGLATAFFAASIGLVQNDIKKVFAYSTVSQLGYMFLGLGAGAFSAGIFHLMTHAFFKALLFLGAGSVIHALGGDQDLRNMGGLAKKIPITCATLFCAGVAIAGVPFTSGHYSKDAILAAAYGHAPWMFWLGAFTAGMTAFYVFRALFLCFFGEFRGHHHPHEAPPSMWIPLAVLAVLSLVGGFIDIPKFLEPVFYVHGIDDQGLVPPAPGEAATHHGKEEGEPAWVGYVPIAAGLGGIALAALLYAGGRRIPKPEGAHLNPLHQFVYRKYMVDELYASTIVHPLVDGSRSLLWRVADAGIIDGAVNGAGRTARAVGGVLKLAQSGNIRNYAAWVIAGTVAVIAVIGLMGGTR